MNAWNSSNLAVNECQRADLEMRKIILREAEANATAEATSKREPLRRSMLVNSFRFYG